jgi:predicted RNA binding protein YcfA (HicA-like mRNA interferase family)
LAGALQFPAVMTVRDVIRVLNKDGWLELWNSNSKRLFGHPAKDGLLTVAGKPGAGIPPKAALNLFKQAGIN